MASFYTSSSLGRVEAAQRIHQQGEAERRDAPVHKHVREGDGGDPLQRQGAGLADVRRQQPREEVRNVRGHVLVEEDFALEHRARAGLDDGVVLHAHLVELARRHHGGVLLALKRFGPADAAPQVGGLRVVGVWADRHLRFGLAKVYFVKGNLKLEQRLQGHAFDGGPPIVPEVLALGVDDNGVVCLLELPHQVDHVFDGLDGGVVPVDARVGDEGAVEAEAEARAPRAQGGLAADELLELEQLGGAVDGVQQLRAHPHKHRLLQQQAADDLAQVARLRSQHLVDHHV
mmetsp:Transcript_47725/g.91207  ORF Transcript_47725/g.91207 Transcript_47725/m.91207 type:complete len:288 (+) Transcript_47725:1171-2034(+)